MNKKPKLLLGAHMSIADSIDLSIKRGQSIGCTSIQIFTHSNRQWSFKDISQEDINKFKEAQKETGIDPIICHASYLINLCSDNNEVLTKSINTIKKEIETCDALGIKYLVLHPGSSTEPKNIAIERLAQSINQVLDNSKNVSVLLELMAGQGNVIGSTFEELRDAIKLIKNKEKIGVCIDTCHAWASGYNFSTKESYQKMWLDFDNTIGLEYLKVIHLNDSKKDLGSKIDRHDNIGKGTIGLDAFKLIMNDKRFESVPKILETPKDSLEDDVVNLELLRNLIE